MRTLRLDQDRRRNPHQSHRQSKIIVYATLLRLMSFEGVKYKEAVSVEHLHLDLSRFGVEFVSLRDHVARSEIGNTSILLGSTTCRWIQEHELSLCWISVWSLLIVSLT